MGFFSKIHSNTGSASSVKTPKTRQGENRQSTDLNVLHNPNAYLAYGGDGIDRGSMMAQQAATRTHQQVLEAQKQREAKESRIPLPRANLPSPTKIDDLSKSVEHLGQIGSRVNFSAFNKETRIYLSQCNTPQFMNAFEAFGFDDQIMRLVQVQWEGGLKDVKKTLIETYKKESKITKNGWDIGKERCARATGRFAIRFCNYNGITVALYGGFDKEKGEPYFDFVVPTSRNEFVAWRKNLMAEYNPKRAQRGLELINLEGDHDYSGALPHEV